MKRFAKRMLALFLSTIMLLGLLTMGASADTPESRFTDLTGSACAESAEALAAAGIMLGVGGGRFAPDASANRAMAITVLGRMAKAEQKAGSEFSDVDSNSWYAGYVGWATENGIVKGDGQGHFMPNKPVTGEQLELMLTRYTQMAGIKYTASNTSTTALTRGELAQMIYAVYLLSPATIRETANGPVRGYIADNGASVWKGIPYAQAQRWQAPTDPQAWTDTLDCTDYGPVAVQSGMDYSIFQYVTKGSENCLNLDVYAPDGAEKLPVLVYVHGGNNQTGNTAEIPGTDLVITNNCVYVSINYRLGLLGFNCLPALQDEGETGNYGMLDIAKALDWVKANISAFGGDPGNITVSGFSAGGRDVMAMLISPMFKDKFDKAIVFSGGMTTADVDKSAVQIAAAIAPLAVEDGKADDEAAAAKWLLTDSAEVSEYLKGVEATRLAPLMADAGIRMSAFPHLYADGVLIPKEGFATTEYNAVPVLMLTGSGEFSLFNGLAPELKDKDAAIQDAAAEFSRKYGSDMYRIFNAQVSADTMFDHYDAGIYVAQVDYEATGKAFSGNYIMGAFHGIFVPMLSSVHGYPTFDLDGFKSVGYTAMAEKFNTYLTSFLKTGDPNSEDMDQWSKWDPSTKLSMVFDGDKDGAIVELKDVSKSYQDIINEMKADTTVSEEVKMAQIKNITNGRWFSAYQDEYFKLPSLWVSDQK